MKTLKTLATILAGALLLVGCGETTGGDANKPKFKLSFDDTYIYDNGVDYAVISATYNDEPLDYSEFVIFDESENVVEWEIVDGEMRFTSTQIGKYKYSAIYGSHESSTSIEVVATPPPAPAAPVDNNPEKTNFVRRSLLVQFTGTSCGYCPYMMNALDLVAKDSKYNDTYVLTAAHNFGDGDPARILDALTLPTALGASSYPSLNVDMAVTIKDRNSEIIKSLLNESKARTTVKGGIAANVKYYEEEGYVIATLLVKAKESGNFRVGAWLLEDGIRAEQLNNGARPNSGVDFNLHNNSIRRAKVSRQTTMDYTGLDLGYIEAGKTAVKEFAFPLKKHGEKGNQEQWNHNNLRVIAYISTEENGKWLVNNVIKAPKDGSVDFEYTE
ncbi:MAG: Omp28-related outer membrane protein [Alistipes sp.]|nr:Omp28-related outer membrane protein [Alistipes sp.]